MSSDTPTPDREALLALAERVEAATEYDGRLMAEIDCAVRFPYLRPAQPDDHRESVHCRDRPFDPSSIWTRTGWLMSRNYWRSVDDAMTLVPERMWAEGSLSSPSMMEVHAGGIFEAVGVGTGRTPAMALTAACLRALAGGRP